MLNKTAIEKLVVLEEKYGLDAILVAPSPDLQFLMGFSPFLCERFQGLFIKKKRRVLLYRQSSLQRRNCKRACT